MTPRNRQTQWVQSNGGPLLLLARSLLPEWGGSLRGTKGMDAKFRWTGEGPATDYDRACDIKDYTGLIPVGCGHALVLGDEPLLTCWWPDETGDGGLFVRWVCADSDQFLQHLQGLVDVRFTSSPHVLEVVEPEHRLFDAAVSGADVKPNNGVLVELEPGSYEVATGRFTPASTTELLLHRLRRRGRNDR